MKKVRFSEIFDFTKKTKRKAAEGQPKGLYPFFTSSVIQKKFIDSKDCHGPSLIFGTGGSANVHYCEGYFSASGDCLMSKPINNKGINTKYAYYFLYKNIHLLEAGFKGAGLKHISKDFISDIKIPLPTLKYQDNVVAALDKANAIRRKREKAIKLADEFLRSVFLDIFGDPVVNPKGWRQVKIKEMCAVKTGNTPSRNVPEYYGDDIEWIKSDNINTPYHYLTKAEEKLSKEGRKVGRVVPANSTLVTCIAGSFDCIGNAALADRSVSFNQQINSITPSDDIDPYFLYLQILIAKRLIQTASTNSMKGMVSKSRFENIMLIKPPFKLQKKFGNIFKKFITTNDNLIQNLKNSDYLFNSLSQNAFSG